MTDPHIIVPKFDKQATEELKALALEYRVAILKNRSDDESDKHVTEALNLRWSNHRLRFPGRQSKES